MTDVSIPFLNFLLCIIRIILHHVLAYYLFVCVFLSLSSFLSLFLSLSLSFSPSLPFSLSLFPPLPLFLSYTNTRTHTHTHTTLSTAMLTEAVFYASTTSGYIIRSGILSLSFIHSFYYITYLCLHIVIFLFYDFLSYDMIPNRIAIHDTISCVATL